MGLLGRGLQKVTKTPGVPQARDIAERSVAPYLRADVHELRMAHGLVVDHLTALQAQANHLQSILLATQASVHALETHQPTILNAIASTNGTSRLLARELDDVRSRVAGQVDRVDSIEQNADLLRIAFEKGDEAVRDDLRPHIETLGWLLQRVETVRAEMMHELRYGAVPSGEAKRIETKIVNPAALEADELRVNFGAGHIALDGFINVDMRELPGIDVVAPVDALPFESGSLNEIFSSHTVEHFPELELRRKLIPYWVSLLKPGGTFRAIVPDLEAMSKAFVDGDMSFDVLRSVLYGGQEYEGDFHFTGFTPSSLGALLTEAGLEAPTVIAKGRPNGDCLEFEISASKPGS